MDLTRDNAKPLISILIPVYNREAFIEDCIQSALDQTYQNLEVVVADNSSTDRTWECCQSAAQRDKRVKIFRNERNLGPVLNWKRCIDEAQGEYGKLLFSDDLMETEFLERGLPLIEDPSVGFLFSSIKVGKQPDQEGEPYWWRRSTGKWASSTFIREALLGGKVPVSPGAALFRLKDLRKNLRLAIPTLSGIDFTRYGAGPDQLLYLLTAADYPKIAYLSDPQIFFRSHPDSITMREASEMIESHYYQARLWFSGTISPPGEGLCGTLQQKLLAHGWLLQKRKQEREPLADFCRRQLADPPPVGWQTVLMVRLLRMLMRYQRSFWRVFARFA
jgi:glycosyltransferase involved in cell wall biosynthesis